MKWLNAQISQRTGGSEIKNNVDAIPVEDDIVDFARQRVPRKEVKQRHSL